MAARDPRSWLDRVVGTCISVLLGAAALFIAVKLVEAVLTSLLVILVVGLLVTATIVVLRSRKRGW